MLLKKTIHHSHRSPPPLAPHAEKMRQLLNKTVRRSEYRGPKPDRNEQTIGNQPSTDSSTRRPPYQSYNRQETYQAPENWHPNQRRSEVRALKPDRNEQAIDKQPSMTRDARRPFFQRDNRQETYQARTDWNRNERSEYRNPKPDRVEQATDSQPSINRYGRRTHCQKYHRQETIHTSTNWNQSDWKGSNQRFTSKPDQVEQALEDLPKNPPSAANPRQMAVIRPSVQPNDRGHYGTPKSDAIAETNFSESMTQPPKTKNRNRARKQSLRLHSHLLQLRGIKLSFDNDQDSDEDICMSMLTTNNSTEKPIEVSGLSNEPLGKEPNSSNLVSVQESEDDPMLSMNTFTPNADCRDNRVNWFFPTLH
ncbi:hypothetical protein WMY93_029528 [Mugilogobius chulae]|uniref:Uncharacterized protein n=1 Tax=Mugilogobius chulae TaxID=88201 RepID=A0AAW0N0G7_9GOBI